MPITQLRRYYQGIQWNTGIKVKGSVEMFLEVQPTKRVQTLWLPFSIYILPSLHTRYLWVNNDLLLLKKSFLSPQSAAVRGSQTKEFAGGKHSWACHVNVISFASLSGWSHLISPLLDDLSSISLTTVDIGQRHPFCVWTTADPITLINEGVPCAKCKSSDTVKSIFPLCHWSPPWAEVTLHSTGASGWTARAHPQSSVHSTPELLAQGLPWMSR